MGFKIEEGQNFITLLLDDEDYIVKIPKFQDTERVKTIAESLQYLHDCMTSVLHSWRVEDIIIMEKPEGTLLENILIPSLGEIVEKMRIREDVSSRLFGLTLVCPKYVYRRGELFLYDFDDIEREDNALHVEGKDFSHEWDLRGGTTFRVAMFNNWVVKVPMREENKDLEQMRRISSYTHFLSDMVDGIIPVWSFGICSIMRKIEGSLLDDIYRHKKMDLYNDLNERLERIKKEVRENGFVLGDTNKRNVVYNEEEDRLYVIDYDELKTIEEYEEFKRVEASKNIREL